jgi:hypothetical protein
VTGECFLQDFTISASPDQVLESRHPRAGRWRVAVNSAPDPAGSSPFTLDQIITIGEPRPTPISRSLGTGETLTQTVGISEAKLAHRAALYDLIDAAVEREVRDNVWPGHPLAPSVTEHPVSGWALRIIQ